jgi:nitroimidazol reductase NimA-like FMN-containing flavoprotein (pyridoxamine 5'-phosphate oxidase superfamily)
MTVEQLEAFGMERMSEDAIRGFLEAQGMGVLALPADPVPYLLPLSFGYDGDSTLYFTYLVGPESQKEQLSAETDRARFLTYNAESAFMWRSVVLTGNLSELPQSEWDDHSAAILDNA